MFMCLCMRIYGRSKMGAFQVVGKEVGSIQRLKKTLRAAAVQQDRGTGP